jgi:N-acetylglutamate synthase-like GNAT family acetyltransferase
MSKTVVRLLEQRDVPVVGPLVHAIQLGEFNVPITLEEQTDLLDPIAFFRHGAGNFWVAEVEGEIVGTIAMLDIGDRIGVLRKMFIVPAYRGAARGIAKHLLDTLVASARDHGLADIYLGTTAAYHAAHRFYEKSGFTEIGAGDLPEAFPRMAVDTKFYRLKLD